LADQMAIAKFSDLEQRLVEIEEKLEERSGHEHPAGERWRSARPGPYHSST
jgi:hypothetical protein